jgi:hypothetical protein
MPKKAQALCGTAIQTQPKCMRRHALQANAVQKDCLPRCQQVFVCTLPAAAPVCLLLVPLQEIVGLGLANFAGSAFNAYSTTGSFSRSAVNYDSGAVLAWNHPRASALCTAVTFVGRDAACTCSTHTLVSSCKLCHVLLLVPAHRCQDGVVWFCDWLRCGSCAAGDDASF